MEISNKKAKEFFEAVIKMDPFPLAFMYACWHEGETSEKKIKALTEIAIRALDKEIEKEKAEWVLPQEDLYLWVVDNIRDPLNDTLFKIATVVAARNNWDMVELYEMVDEMTEEVREGILNIINTYGI